jgi:uncharacterized membrane protein YraQ (UPF0718 family)
MGWLWISLYHALAMLWETFWALVLGFSLSAVLQVFVSKEQMTRSFGRAGLREVALATGLGAASSSCSYAAVAAAKTAFKKGAALVPVLAFMFASTNLVFELGAVLWLLMGWLFVLAEVIGAFVLIGVMWLIVRFTLPESLEADARRHVERAEASASCHEDHPPSHCSGVAGEHEQERGEGKWRRVASAFVMDVSMLWKELIIGFLIAGFLSALVPANWWQTLFLSDGPAWLRLIENAILGPIIAIASFVCSIGNIPLASILWSSGISFGGVISFIYADLIVIPLIFIYGKYYGLKAASYIVTVLFVSMAVSGIIVDLIFSALHLIPSGTRPANPVAHAMISWNYTSWLDIAALFIAGLLLFLHLRRTSSGRHFGQMHHAHH